MGLRRLTSKQAAPGVVCKICGVTADKCDHRKHFQVFIAEYAQKLRLKKEKALIWNSRKGTTTPSARLPHNQLIHNFRLDEMRLPPAIRFQILLLDIKKAEGKREEVKNASTEIAASLQHWYLAPDKNTSEWGDALKLQDMAQKLLNQTVKTDSEAFLWALVRPMGIVHKAKALLPAIQDPLAFAEYEHLIDLIRKRATQQLTAIKESSKSEVKPPFVSSTEAELKKQYAELLEKNIIPIADYIRKKIEERNAEIQAFVKLNTTNILTYTYDEKTGELKGNIANIASKTILVHKSMLNQ